MKQTNFLFLRVLRSALKGEKVNMEELTPEQWREILAMAEEHKLLPMVLDTLGDCPGLQNMEMAQLAAFRRQARHHVLMQTLRTGEFLALNRTLRAAGVKPLVVKGLVCRQLYPKPDLRPSGDEDVLVSEAQFALYCRLLQEAGLTPGTEDAEASEIPFRKTGSPLYIELHKHLFEPQSQVYGDLNRFFGNVIENAVELEIGGERVATMAPTDHLLYLICHALKHFLHSGFGIRQVCDIVLFARRYDTGICWEQVLRCCGEIRAERFAGAIFRIGENYLNVAAPGVFRAVEADEMPLLKDLLEGGLYGDATLSRKHSSNITLEAVAARKQGKRARSAMGASVFPSASKLEGKYPYLKKHSWLLPVAWGQRLWNYARETRKNQDSSAAEALKIGAERVELLRHYGIIS